MKMVILIVIVLLIVILTRCDKDKSKKEILPIVNKDYVYTEYELKTLDSINTYRVSIGLNALEKDGFVSQKCEEHNIMMIFQDSLSHNGYTDREIAIMKSCNTDKVAENIAYNFATPQTAVNAWLNSPGHKENIEGDFTHFGISIREDTDLKKYYTNIFYKKIDYDYRN